MVRAVSLLAHADRRSLDRHNFAIHGQPIPRYYRSGAFSVETQFVEGPSGVLFSPSRGLFVFSPVLLFALSGFVLALC